MKRFELTLRFDNEEQSLSATKGLSIAQLGQLLVGMNRALRLKDDEHMTLSSIKSNCYAPVFTTPDESVYRRSKILHEQIAQGDTSILSGKDRKYANILFGILKSGMTLEVYNSDKSFNQMIKSIEKPVTYNHYYETDAVRGILTKIGNRNLDTKITIRITNLSEEIEISKQQEKVLKKHLKEGEIEFYITKKINKHSGKVEHVTLDDFEILSYSDSFYTQIATIRERYGNYVSSKNK